MHRKINHSEIANKYNNISDIWNQEDKWHMWTHKMIKSFILSCSKQIPFFDDLMILNAGSAGYSYNLPEKNIFHIDIAQNKLFGLPNSKVTNIENITLPDSSFDFVICVGSVVNYCDPYKVLSEFKRVLKNSGYLILEFENSHTLELIGRQEYNKSTTMIETFYNGEKEALWYFSERFILKTALLYGFSKIEIDRCHIISPLFMRIFKKEKLAASFAKLDSALKWVPGLRKFSSNTIILFKT